MVLLESGNLLSDGSIVVGESFVSELVKLSVVGSDLGISFANVTHSGVDSTSKVHKNNIVKTKKVNQSSCLRTVSNVRMSTVLVSETLFIESSCHVMLCCL